MELALLLLAIGTAAAILLGRTHRATRPLLTPGVAIAAYSVSYLAWTVCRYLWEVPSHAVASILGLQPHELADAPARMLVAFVPPAIPAALAVGWLHVRRERPGPGCSRH